MASGELLVPDPSDCESIAREERRLRALRELEILDTPESESFDRITRMASRLFRTPISAISLTDRDRQWFKSHIGTQGREIIRGGAPCAEVTKSAAVVAIPDLLQDSRFSQCYLAEAGIRFYAGAPLTTRDGYVLGAMCVLDTEPRSITTEEMSSLEDLAAFVMAQIELQRDVGRVEPASGLPNRYQLAEDLTNLERKALGEWRVAVLIDLADLRQMSETVSVLGSNYIDTLVKASTSAIKSTLGDNAGLYQVGITSFFLLINESEGKLWWDVIESLRKQLTAPIVCDGVPVAVEAAYGISPFCIGKSPPHDVLRTVLSAARDAREADIEYAVYSPDSDEANRRRFTVLTNVRKAVEQGGREFSLVYQPRIDLHNGICTGAEALLRWTHPTLGSVAPGEFIPLVEQTALARPVTQWVLTNALAQLATWRRAGLDTRVSINISARNLEEDDFVLSVQQALQRFAVSPTYIELEFTESALIRHRSRAIEKLEQIRSLGVELAIDDFGTGYSSFSYLQKLPATTVKLDRSFMPELAKSQKDQILVRSMISMAHDLGYRVVAEGVETAEVYSFLKECGCDEVQGYFISRPLPVPAFEAFLRQGRDRDVSSMLTLLQKSAS